MLTRQPERPARANTHKYFYGMGLLSGICLTLLSLSILATIRSDYFQANLYMGITGLLLAILGLVPVTMFYRMWRQRPIDGREGEGRLAFLRNPVSMVSLSLSCMGMALFSQNMLPLLLGASSFVPDIISWLFLGSGLILLYMSVKRLAAAYERMQQAQTASDQNLPAED